MAHYQEFSDLDLLDSLQETLAEKNLVTLTEIQKRAIPALLDSKSIVAVAETGSGKTLTFALPILHQLKCLEHMKDAVEDDAQPRAVVIVPSRELGEQVAKAFKPFTHTTRLRVRTVLGGTDLDVAKRNIAGPFEVLVATPGRVIKLLERKLLSFRDVRILIFDEADQMLDAGFLPDADRIVQACPKERQLALFSATYSPEIQKIVGEIFADAEVIRTSGHHRTVPGLTTQNITVHDGKRFPHLEELLKKKVSGGTLIFANTRGQCDALEADMKKAGFACVSYRGEMDKIERRNNLRKFREGAIPYLIATDLGGRGLDIDHVGRVINYHLPREMDNYLHRVGRTARAGRTGLVINLVTERDQPLMAQLRSSGNSN